MINGSESSGKCVFIRSGQNLQRVFIKEILWIQSEGNYCIVYTQEKKFKNVSILKDKAKVYSLPNNNYQLKTLNPSSIVYLDPEIIPGYYKIYYKKGKAYVEQDKVLILLKPDAH